MKSPFDKNLLGTAESLKGFPGKQKHEKLSLAMENKNMAIFYKFQIRNRQKTVKRGESLFVM